MSPASDADLARCFVRSFDRAVAEGSGGAMIALREDTIALAAAIRATTPKPERAVVLLKTILRGHLGNEWVPSIAAPCETDLAHRDSLVYYELFEWWITAYYEASVPEPQLPAARAGTTA